LYVSYSGKECWILFNDNVVFIPCHISKSEFWCDTVEDWEIMDMDWEAAMSVAIAEVEAIEPTFKEAKHLSDWLKWQEAIKVELATLKAAGIWTIIKCPKNTNVVDSKWVLHIKKNSAGEIEKYKAYISSHVVPPRSMVLTTVRATLTVLVNNFSLKIYLGEI
jgi:hypothetical protein